MPLWTFAYPDSPPAALRGCAVSIGNFDGVHRGHAALIARLAQHARALGGPAVVLSFEPHPMAVLDPARLLVPLTAPADRADWLHQAGADHVVYLRASRELLRLSAEEFLDRILGAGFEARAVVEGFNFRFGRDRAGDLPLLERWGTRRGARVEIVAPVRLDGELLSSRGVRAGLEAGDLDKVTRWLGRPYLLRGLVALGKQRGRTLGFPTVNIEQAKTLVPRDGVYAVRARLPDGSHRLGAANIGANPTFGEQVRKLEIHLLYFAGDLYDQPLAIEFHQRLRETRPFADKDDLIAQLHRDVAGVRRRFANAPEIADRQELWP